MDRGALEAGEAAKAAPVAGVDELADMLRVLSNPKRLRILQYLVEPHYLEEIASAMKMARQTAQEHVQQLAEIGVIRRVGARKDKAGAVDYVVVPQRLFSIHVEVGKLGVLEPEVDDVLRPPTSPMVTGTGAPVEQDLPRLILVNGMRVGETTALTGQGPWLVGRDPAAPVCLDYDPYISTRHAEVRRAGNSFELADLYSSNGTWVDWKRVPRGAAVALPNGGAVRVGKSILLFRKTE